jgi:hypothetical protein
MTLRCPKEILQIRQRRKMEIFLTIISGGVSGRSDNKRVI